MSKLRLKILMLATLLSGSSQSAWADCSLTRTGNVPLTDLTGTYRGAPGGLYPGGSSRRPEAHEAVGIDIATNQVRPLDALGNFNANGRIVMISVGMSNTSTEFARFLTLMRDDPAVSPRVTIVNGALANQTADRYRDPQSPAWQWIADQVRAGGATPLQVQVAWIKVALPGFGTNTTDPLDNFPAFSETLRADLETISRNVKRNFPNVRLAYFSSRIRSYTTPRGLSPEPTAYETGFAVRGAIARQLDGAPDLALTAAPWMSWGPYLWADGLMPRSDGLTYACSDLESDFVHPGPGAATKVAEQLKAFLLTDRTATPWFIGARSGAPVIQSLTATPAGGEPSVSVQFSASASDGDGIRDYVWSFGDGTHAFGQRPIKTFHVAGLHTVRLTVVDSSGSTATRELPFQVGSVAELPQPPRNLRVVPTP